VDGWTVESNSGATAEAIKENLTKKDEGGEPEKAEAKPDPSKAGSELGKLGGKASAEKRAAEAKEAEKREKREAREAEAKEKPEAEDEPEADDKGKGNPRHDPGARVAAAARKEAEAKRALAAERAERERDRQELQQTKTRLEALERGETPKPQEKPKLFDPSKPRAEDYDDYEQYLDDRDQWNRLRWESEQRGQRQQSAHERSITEAAHRYAAKVTEAGVREKLSEDVLALRPVFDLEQGERPTGANFLASAIMASPDNAPGLLVHFSEHPEDLERISDLTSVHAVLREVGRIEARLEGAAPPPKEREREAPKAPPPVKSVSGAPFVPDDVEYKPGIDFDRYAAGRLKQIRSQR